MWRAEMMPLEVWRRDRPPFSSLGRFSEGSSFVTGVLVCRFSFLSLINLSNMKAISLYGQRLPAVAVRVAAGAPLTRNLLRRVSASVMMFTSFPRSGASCFNFSTSFAAALARAVVQKVLQPGRERHSQGMSFSSMKDLTVW